MTPVTVYFFSLTVHFPRLCCSFVYLQLPHFGEEQVKAISSAKPAIKGIAEYIKLKEEDRMVG